MWKRIAFIFSLLATFSCSNQRAAFDKTDEKRLESSIELPQGEFSFEIYFAEFGGKMANQQCIVRIEGINARVTTVNLEVIYEGTIQHHQSGEWILSTQEKDISAIEIGGCTGIPIIDFEKKVIEWC